MKTYLPILSLLFALQSPLSAVEVKVTITPVMMETNDYAAKHFEFKLESDQKGEMTTKKWSRSDIKVGQPMVWQFQAGNQRQNIWFWWDTLIGIVDLKIEVDGTVVINGRCYWYKSGEKNVEETMDFFDTYADATLKSSEGRLNIRKIIQDHGIPDINPRVVKKKGPTPGSFFPPDGRPYLQKSGTKFHIKFWN